MIICPFMAIAQQGRENSSIFDNSWQNVGNGGFSSGVVQYTNLAFSPTGQLFVAFQDNANSGKTTVMKFDGATWSNVGAAGFSAGGHAINGSIVNALPAEDHCDPMSSGLAKRLRKKCFP